MTDQTDRRTVLEREKEEAQAELDQVRADHTGSQQFAAPRIRDLIQRIHEIDKELEQIDLAIELERQMDA
jgi:capsule polysaccharide export protein KpsE/RkpR